MPDPKNKDKRKGNTKLLKDLVNKYAVSQEGDSGRQQEVSVSLSASDPEFQNEQEFNDYFYEKAKTYMNPAYMKMVEKGKMDRMDALRMSSRIRSFPSYEYYVDTMRKRKAAPLGGRYLSKLPKRNLTHTPKKGDF